MHTHISERTQNNLVKEQVIYNGSKAKYMCRFKRRCYKQRAHNVISLLVKTSDITQNLVSGKFSEFSQF